MDRERETTDRGRIMDRERDRQTHRQRADNGQRERQTDRQIDRQTDRQRADNGQRKVDGERERAER